MGKLPNKYLKRLLGCIKENPKVVVKPQFGFDSGVHKLKDNEYMVVSTDPCIGVPEEWFGWLLIHYVASDVALFGAKTEFCTINLLGPPTTKPPVFHKIMKQACGATDEMGISIVSGHTRTYDGLSSVVGVCTGYGRINKDKLITPAGAKPNDSIACIKPASLETKVNFASAHEAIAEKLFGSERTKELKNLVPLQSCVKEAMQLAGIMGVHAMHDATEGGIVTALNEIAVASNVGFRVDWNSFLFPKEVQILKDKYRLSDLQVLSMSSTGTVLAAVSSDAVNKVEAIMQQIVADVRFVGCFTKELDHTLVKDRKEQAFPRVADDPYARLVE
jgi:hydrogenase expression/formation protein HypE